MACRFNGNLVNLGGFQYHLNTIFKSYRVNGSLLERKQGKEHQEIKQKGGVKEG